MIDLDWSEDISYTLSNAELIPDAMGVYKILRQATGKNLYRVYVGQGNFRERCLAHLRPDEPNTCLRERLRNYDCLFRYALVFRQADRDEIEEELINQGTECNQTAS